MEPKSAVMRHDPRQRSARARVRRATLADVGAIMEIERASFSSPWPVSAIEEEIERRTWSRVALAVSGDEVLGFIVYWVVDKELHLLNLATRPESRRQGVARSLINHMIDEGRRRELWQVVLEVRESNDTALELYERYGFVRVGRRPRYYTDNGEDAIVMSMWFGEGEAPIE
jgi:ribosomal-protein-alanine N-acetyltransferase